MKILIVTVYYPPVISSLSVMMQEVAEGLSQKGHDITVATAKPHADLNLTKTQLGISFNTYSIENKVRVIRAETPPLKTKMYVLRGLIQLALPYILFKQIRKYSFDGFDAVMISTPPLPLTKIGIMIKKKYNSKFILFVQDIYPQTLIDIGAMKNKIIVKYFEKITQNVYDSADLITSHTRGNRKYIINNNNIDKNKIFYLPNWIDLSPYNTNHEPHFFRKKYKLEDKFIFLFAGVIGLGQGLELLVSALVKTKTIPDNCCFLIVGKGSEKKKIQNLVKDYNYRNIVFKPFVSLEEYPSLVKDVDVGIVCLDSRLSTPVVPGKMLGFMAASLPIIAFLNKESDGHYIIKEANCGYSINSDASPDAINSLIIKMFNEKEKLKEFGQNGYQYVTKHYNKNECIDKISYLLDANI